MQKSSRKDRARWLEDLAGTGDWDALRKAWLKMCAAERKNLDFSPALKRLRLDVGADENVGGGKELFFADFSERQSTYDCDFFELLL